MIIRSKAPLRLGFAGGGTDISAYYNLYGGYVLNAAIDMYAYCTIEPLDNRKIFFMRQTLIKKKRMMRHHSFLFLRYCAYIQVYITVL